MELVGVSEIAELAKVTKQAVSNWRLRYDDFPKPIQEIQSGPVWDREVVDSWVKARKGEQTHVLSFINLKGGVGKTTSAVAVAEILAHEHRKNVLVVDLDPQTNATVTLISEDRWAEMNQAGQTLAQLFQDRINEVRIKPAPKPRFDIKEAIVRQVSTIDGGIARLDLLPSSLDLLEILDELPSIAMSGNFAINPLEILKKALVPVMERYDYVILDCPPSLGVITKNGLRISTGYVIPTVPDILSTWGIFQIVRHISKFSEDLDRPPIPALGIIATRVQANALHRRILGVLETGRLSSFAMDDQITQPPLFKSQIPQTVDVARGADFAAEFRTLKQKYGDEAYRAFVGLTEEIRTRCEAKKQS